MSAMLWEVSRDVVSSTVYSAVVVFLSAALGSHGLWYTMGFACPRAMRAMVSRCMVMSISVAAR